MYAALRDGRIHYMAKGGETMRRCIYHGYWFPCSTVKEMGKLAKDALDAVRHSRIHEYPADLSIDEIGRLIEEAFAKDHPGFRAIEGELEFLN